MRVSLAPLANYFLVPVSLGDVALTTEGLQVAFIKEVSAYWPGDDVVYHLRCNIPPRLQALGTYRMLRPPPAAKPGPAIGMIRIRRPWPLVSPFIPRL